MQARSLMITMVFGHIYDAPQHPIPYLNPPHITPLYDALSFLYDKKRKKSKNYTEDDIDFGRRLSVAHECSWVMDHACSITRYHRVPEVFHAYV